MPLVACSAKSLDWVVMLGAMAVKMPPKMAKKVTRTITTERAEGTLCFRNQRTGGHNTVDTMIANSTGSRPSHTSARPRHSR